MDDVFVMMNAFMRTNPALSVPVRLSRSYEEAAVSITLTSATNIATFAVGACSANYGTVHLFCVFCGWAVASIYFFTVIMFGALVALLTRAELRFKDRRWCFEITSYFFARVTRILQMTEKFDVASAWGETLVILNRIIHLDLLMHKEY